MQFVPDSSDRHRDSDLTRSFHVPACIPLFPLPNIVFFPKTYFPLHVFEPRYCEMVADVAEDGRCLGMALFKDGWEEEYYGTPPIFPIGCVGRIVSVQKFPDGRLNIFLQGLERYEVVREFSGKSYRQADITLKPQDTQTPIEPALRQDLLQVLERSLKHSEEGHFWHGFFPSDGSDAVLVNTLSTHLDFSPLEKQFLLEADSLLQQARRLSDLIQFKVHEREGLKGWG